MMANSPVPLPSHTIHGPQMPSCASSHLLRTILPFLFIHHMHSCSRYYFISFNNISSGNINELLRVCQFLLNMYTTFLVFLHFLLYFTFNCFRKEIIETFTVFSVGCKGSFNTFHPKCHAFNWRSTSFVPAFCTAGLSAVFI